MSQTLQTVEFHGHRHTLLEHNGEPYVAMRAVVEAIGLDWKSQHRRIQNHAVMGSVVVMTTTTGTDGKAYEMFCLPLKLLNGWLFGVEARRVKPELRETLIEYQRQCFDVLWRHWQGEPQAVPPESELPPAPQHRADHIVAATRVFNGLMRAATTLKLARHDAVAAANEAASRATGYDIVEALGAQHALAPPATVLMDMSTPHWLPTLKTWCEAHSGPVSLEELARALSLEPSNRTALKLATELRRLGWSSRKVRFADPRGRERQGMRWSRVT